MDTRTRFTTIILGWMCQRMVIIEGEYRYKTMLTLWAVTFVNIADPYNMEATPEPEPEAPPHSSPIRIQRVEERIEAYSPFDDARGLEALSTAATSNYD